MLGRIAAMGVDQHIGIDGNHFFRRPGTRGVFGESLIGDPALLDRLMSFTTGMNEVAESRSSRIMRKISALVTDDPGLSAGGQTTVRSGG